MDVTYALLDGERARRVKSDLVALYALVYAEPPYEEGPEQVRRFSDTFDEETRRPGFALVRALAGNALAGAAYGWTMAAGQWWSNAVGEPPRQVREAPKFAVMEWIVHPDRRRRGIGRDLIRMLLTDRPEPWATLASDPRSAARTMYARAGWREVGHSKLSWGPAMDLLTLPLAGHGGGSAHVR